MKRGISSDVIIQETNKMSVVSDGTKWLFLVSALVQNWMIRGRGSFLTHRKSEVNI